jgi:hypothetical protein
LRAKVSWALFGAITRTGNNLYRAINGWGCLVISIASCAESKFAVTNILKGNFITINRADISC